jgi:predicted anti-sigma-YlaC factor YlaD
VSRAEIVCREFVELATDHLDGVLPEPTLELVEEHLAMCDWCRTYEEQLEAASRAVADAGADEPGPDALGSLLDAFRRRGGEPQP